MRFLSCLLALCLLALCLPVQAGGVPFVRARVVVQRVAVGGYGLGYGAGLGVGYGSSLALGAGYGCGAALVQPVVAAPVVQAVAVQPVVAGYSAGVLGVSAGYGSAVLGINGGYAFRQRFAVQRVAVVRQRFGVVRSGLGFGAALVRPRLLIRVR